ncbi:penicillin-binding transpeptidase domain-containing protein [Nonomuraea indica]|uniref:penicillin-binding transpeptidase domain-containing protein n=1 Tax=Nonomuraea indica TaxID=1581193 RepID=UPI001FE92C9C|nr:penicillin-binding transpeptidase domain-containing protein [Nonomuraea indica]
MRETGGKGQGPGRGAGGAGSQGGAGAVRRRPGGPGRQGGSARSEGTGRPSPDERREPRNPRKQPDPFDLPFGSGPAADARRLRPPRDDAGGHPGDDEPRGGTRRPRAGDEPAGAGRRSRTGDEQAEGAGRRPRGADDPAGTARRRSRTGDEPAGGRGAEDGDGPRPGGRARHDGAEGARRSGETGRAGARLPQAGDERARGRARQDGHDRGRERAPREDADAPRARPGQDDGRGRTRAAPAAASGRARDNRLRSESASSRTRSGETSGRARDGRARSDEASNRARDGRTRSDEAAGRARDGRTRSDEAAGRAREGWEPRDGARRGWNAWRPWPDGDERRPGRGGDGPRPPRRPPAPPRPPKPPLVLRLGNPRRRINIGLIGMTFILSIFAGRLIQMQGLDSKVYEAAAAGQRLHKEVIPAKRGTITDAGGHALAVTVEAREVAIDPSKVPADVRPKVAAVLARHLGKPEQEMTAKLARVDTRYQLLARDVDPVVADRLLKAGVPALTEKRTYRRLYPGGDLAGSLIGFVGDEGKGLGGIEAARNSLLAGRDGELRAETGRDGQRIPMTSSQRTAPVDGRDVRLTIDRDIQWAAQRTLAEQVEKSGASSGTVIVMDVRTAQILAMANAPELDLDNWRRSSPDLYINRAASDVFEPGSTNKVITAAAALEAGAVTPGTVFHVKDNIRCADRTLRDAHPHPPQAMTFQEAMAQSSNVATIMAARKIGDAKLYEMLRAFGFGSRPGGGVPGAGAGLLPDHKGWSGSQSCTVAYGQGVSVTALQMASVYQTIANGGVKVEPQLVAGTTDTGGRFVPAPPGKQTRVVSEKTAKEITTMLESAVSAQGTGELAAIPGYRVAGKTGTADRYDQQLGRYDGYTASFAGFSPADAPRLVVLSVLQNPKNGHFGGQVAAPVFKDVMTFAIKSRKIPPTGSAAPPARTRAGQ